MAKTPKDDKTEALESQPAEETSTEVTGMDMPAAPRPDRDAPEEPDVVLAAPEGLDEAAGEPAEASEAPAEPTLAAPVHDPRDSADSLAAALGSDRDDPNDQDDLAALDGQAPETQAPEPMADTPETDVPPAPPPPPSSASSASSSPPPSAAAPQETIVKHRFFPALLGGVIAAGIGFGAALWIFPEGLPSQQGTTLSDDVAALQAEVSALKEATPQEPDLSGISGEVEALKSTQSGLESGLSETSATLSALTDRIAALEEGGSVAPEAVQDLNRQVSELNQALDAQKSELEAQITTAAEQSKMSAALTELDTALDTGEPFAEPVNALKDTGASVPEALESHAASGVATMADLQESFPDFARDALGATWDMGDTSSVLSFMKTQLGMRSLTPQEGNSPDAILSRAEAALRDRDLETALSELDTLPEAAKAEMQGWVDMATARAEVIEARSGLESATQTN
ncbi:COG4223 family protein [Pseudooceanicola sp. HF7]|uniref:COG4223 family protein n=1 Tax=Pseudooceanicola sp. HF7 TaxID=2721560 RepID=UPI001430B5EC|nr:hypothetical protein [Pseudooceanicola sp. HF7]NIZ09577.1 hypothetical protein [Pseudooceanicola sp. HF7]